METLIVEKAIFQGYQRLACHVVLRAINDLEKYADLAPSDARTLSGHPNGKQGKAACEVALALGFKSPKEDVLTFLKSAHYQFLLEVRQG